MTKEQAIELCKEIWNASSTHGALRVLHPGIGTIDSWLSQSYQTKQEKEWASLFRELAEALDPRENQPLTKQPCFLPGTSVAKDYGLKLGEQK